MRTARAHARALFEGDTLAVARRLIGARLVHENAEGRTAGRIVETEAYLAGDPASHSFSGPSERNASMFLAPGHAYVYLIYGVHLCFNVVTAPRGVGEAVLVRALEPLEGLELMAARRGREAKRELCNGPAKLVQAMGFDREADGTDLTRGSLRLLPPEPGFEARLDAGPRIGVTQAAEKPFRFTLRGCGWVSR